MGSIGGGGRYDALTGMFGLKGLTGAGISFGADRIYDVLLELNLFASIETEASTKILLVNFGTSFEAYLLPILQHLRELGVGAEIYPSAVKLAKQLKYADDKKIPYVLLVGEDEMETGILKLKNMLEGTQESIVLEQLIEKFKP